MFKRIEGKITEIDEGFSIKVLGREDLLYMQGDKVLKINSEYLINNPHGYDLVLYTGRIHKWSSGESIDEETKKKIINNTVRAFEWEGSKIKVEDADM